MKNFNFSLALFVVAVFALLSFSPVIAYADTVTLTLETAPYDNTSSEYVYPYNFSVNGSSSTVPLMCVDFYSHISFGESWTATITSIIGNTQYEQAAYIFSLASAPGATADTIAEAQWANWDLFQTNELSNAFLTGVVPSSYQSSVTTILNNAAAYVSNPSNSNSSLYSEYEIFVPASWPSGDGTPQDFIGGVPSQNFSGPSPTPEPDSLILLGTGMFGIATFIYRRKRIA